MLEKWHTNNTNLGQYPRTGMYISLQLGGSWINGVLDGHLFQVLFPILFTLHTVFWGEIYA